MVTIKDGKPTPQKISPELYNLVCYFMQKAKEDDIFITPMKIQKMVYYSWAWSLTLLDKEPFSEKVEAWDKGPVVHDLWIESKVLDLLKQDEYECDMSKFDTIDMAVFEQVWEYYSKFSAEKLSEMTHLEEPWIEARKAHVNKYGKNSNRIKCSQIIDKDKVKDFYNKQNEYISIIDTFYIEDARDAQDAYELVVSGNLKFK